MSGSQPPEGGGELTNQEFLKHTAEVLQVDQPGQPRPGFDKQVLNGFGERPNLAEAGDAFQGSWIADHARDFTGGNQNTGEQANGEQANDKLPGRLVIDGDYENADRPTFACGIQHGASGSSRGLSCQTIVPSEEDAGR